MIFWIISIHFYPFDALFLVSRVSSEEMMASGRSLLLARLLGSQFEKWSKRLRLSLWGAIKKTLGKSIEKTFGERPQKTFEGSNSSVHFERKIASPNNPLQRLLGVQFEKIVKGLKEIKLVSFFNWKCGNWRSILGCNLKLHLKLNR